MSNSDKYDFETTPKKVEFQAVNKELAGSVTTDSQHSLFGGSKGCVAPLTDAQKLESKGGVTSGNIPPLSNLVLSGNCLEAENDVSHDSNDKEVSAPADVIAKRKTEARRDKLEQTKGKSSSIDEKALELEVLGAWMSDKDDEILADFFGSKTFHMWKEGAGLNLPHAASARVGYYIAAVNGLRKIGYTWEQLLIKNGEGHWVGVREDLLDAYVSGFFSGLGLVAHMSSIKLSRSLVDFGRKEVERLSWSESDTHADDLKQWVDSHIRTNTIDGVAYYSSSKELYTAYQIIKGDTTMTNVSFGRRFSLALQALRKEELSRGIIERSNNIRHTTLCGKVKKCAGWIGLKFTCTDFDRLKVKELLGELNPLEKKMLDSFNSKKDDAKTSKSGFDLIRERNKR